MAGGASVRILITGGSGFIGSHVMRVARAAGHVAINIDRANPVDPVNLCDYCPAEEASGADAVIHLAAKADVRNNWEAGQIEELFMDNDLATQSILSAAAQSDRVRTFVLVSTGAVYSPEVSPYAASKMACEAWARAYADKHGWRLVIARPAACFGKGYHHGHVADFVRQAKEAGHIRSLTRGQPREACHVEDVADVLVSEATDSKSESKTGGVVSGLWGCRGTAEMMGVPATYGVGDRGWIGDTYTTIPATWRGTRDVENGVRDALATMGWMT